MSWFTRKPSLIGQRVHAWHWTEWGQARIEGEVVDEDEYSYYLDVGQESRAWTMVWKHDTRPLAEPLPGDETGWTTQSL